jgi:hypothetical protein
VADGASVGDLTALAEALARTAAGLQQHIEDRAQEFAAPQIAASKAAIADAVIAAGIERRRLEDLVAELRRQLEVQLGMVARYRGWLDMHGINLLTGEKRT